MKNRSHKLNKRILLFLIFIGFGFNTAHSQETFTSKPVVGWQNIKSYAFNNDQTLAVFEMILAEKSMLFISHFVDGKWSDVVLIPEINDYLGGAVIVGGPFFDYSGKTLYFNANYSDSKGGLDIYFSEWDGKKWSNPKNLGEPVNSSLNEESPSITASGDKLFFTRNILLSKIKRDAKELGCKSIFYSIKNTNAAWETPISMAEPININCEATPYIAPDGKTLYFSSIRNDAETFDVYFTREIMKNSWLIPIPCPGTIGDNDDYNPEFHNGNIYHLSAFIKKNVFNGLLYFNSLPDDMKPIEMIEIAGKISDLSGKPLKANLYVHDPVTSKLLGRYNSDSITGLYAIPLLPKLAYLINVRKESYSFASFYKDFSTNSLSDTAVQNVSLFNTVKLNLVVFDSEIFKPLSATVKITNNANGEVMNVKTVNSAPGRYQVELPIGINYKISANSEGFETGAFDFSLNDDIIFSDFERNLPLVPKKQEFVINVSDFETQEDVAAEIVIYNLTRDETIVVTAEDIVSGKATVMLREGDKYEFNINGPKGYSFFNSTVDLKSETEKRSLDVELKPLNAKTSITLNNITFEPNSADLNEQSFAELNRVVLLIHDNPSIVVEISAHTDDVGSDNYNLKLSERRAESVVNYLVEKGVPVKRLVPRGYGESVPLAPNDTEENKKINRRVEFKIVGFTDETTK